MTSFVFVGPLLSIKETNGVMSLVLKGEGESSKLLFMNLALSAGMKATMKREGKKVCFALVLSFLLNRGNWLT